MGDVEKLELILRAEDGARIALEDAQRAAAESIASARVAAAETLRVGSERTREAAAELRDAVLAEAREQVLELEDAATHDARSIVDDARTRTDAALDAVLAVLRGR